MRKLDSDFMYSEWKVWKNSDGMNNTLRTHLRTHHFDIWSRICKAEHLKATTADTVTARRLPSDSCAEFTMNGFIERLIRWIVADDQVSRRPSMIQNTEPSIVQSINVIECPEFREFIEYSCRQIDGLCHRTALTLKIMDMYEREYCMLLKEFELALGRISLTSDVWSDVVLRSYMGITAHWCAKNDAGQLVLRSQLLAIRELSGQHTGANLASVFVDILKKARIVNKVLSAHHVYCLRHSPFSFTAGRLHHRRQCKQLLHHDGEHRRKDCRRRGAFQSRWQSHKVGQSYSNSVACLN